MSVSWGSIRVEDLIGPVNGTLLSGPVEKRPAGLGTDSRSIRAGELFWCLTGENFDGHDFLADAIEKGACAAVVQHDRFSREMTFTRHEAGRSGSGSKEPAIIAVDDSLKALGDLARWWRKNHSAGVLAVTGSSGKTTAKEMSASILSVEGNVLKSRGNYNNLIGLPLTIFDLCEAHDKVVLEMGMNRPGEIGRLTEIADPDAGLILNVGMAHLEGLGDIRGVAEAKTEMLSKMSGKAIPIINRDDSLLFETAVSIRKDLITFGMGRKNDFRATNVKDFGTGGLSFDLHPVSYTHLRAHET